MIVGQAETVTEYVLHGKNITHLTRGTDELHFYYDAQGKPSIVIFNGTAYGYLYNLQGDVVALVDSTGAKVVEYTYDAWGKPTGKTGSLANTLGTVQPFRYRGYVWDEETGDYYLRSRYYRYKWERFFTADAVVKGNLYYYCRNRPVIQTDENGYEAAYTIITDEMINCYAYAFRIAAGSVIGSGFRITDDSGLLQPGMMSHSEAVMNKYYDRFLSLDAYTQKLIDNVMRDAPYMGVTIESVESADVELDENSWLVALVVQNSPISKLADIGINIWDHPQAYHWYRQEKSGDWTHKDGKDAPTYLDKDKKIITDPMTCNRGRYNVFVGYFKVTRIHGLTMEDLE